VVGALLVVSALAVAFGRADNDQPAEATRPGSTSTSSTTELITTTTLDISGAEVTGSFRGAIDPVRCEGWDARTIESNCSWIVDQMGDLIVECGVDGCVTVVLDRFIPMTRRDIGFSGQIGDLTLGTRCDDELTTATVEAAFAVDEVSDGARLVATRIAGTILLVAGAQAECGEALVEAEFTLDQIP